MAKVGKISEDFVKRLKPPEVGQHIEWDDKIPGFGVRINAGGSIAFVLNYTLNKKRKRYRIGRYPSWNATTARQRAKDLTAEIDKGVDPQDVKVQREEEPTFSELAKKYLEHAETYKRPGSLRNDKGNIRRLLPQWGDVKLGDFRLSDVEKIHSNLKASPYHANRVLALLSHMFTKAVDWELCEASPIKKGATKKMRFEEERRQNLLNTDQQAKLLKALDRYQDQNAANAIRLLLFTGSRENEVLKADWKQFDLTPGAETWTKPSHATKQKRTERIPLGSKAVAVLKKLKPKKDGPLFPGADTKTKKARATIRKPWMQVLRSAGLAEVFEKQGKRRKVKRYKPTIRLHDLRHTFASDLVSRSVSIYFVSKLIGHTNVATTQRYADPNQEALREAVNQFGGKS